MTAQLLPRCESCGKTDEPVLKALLNKGQLGYGPQPEVRAPILCPECREIFLALIRAAKESLASVPAPELEPSQQ